MVSQQNPPILIFHGALGSASQLSEIQTFLESKGEKVSIVEFEGHGSTTLKGSFSMESCARQVQKAVSESDAPPLIFGYSMGGYAALMASLMGSAMAGIITLGTKMDWSPEIAAAEIRMLNPEKLLQKVPAFAQDLEKRHKALNWKELLAKTSEMMMALGENPPLNAEKLGQLSLPVLYALGDRDEMVSAEETLRAYRNTPGASMSILPGTRHPIEKLNPDLLYFLIEQWRTKYPTTQKVS